MADLADILKYIVEVIQTTDKKEEKLVPGDIIGISRGLYSHYGVYINARSVIHYSSEDSDTDQNAVIRETSLRTFKRGDEGLFKLSFPPSHECPSHAPVSAVSGFWPFPFDLHFKDLSSYHLYTPEETISRARSRLGENRYNLLFNNCEHFAIWCKTGVSESWQVNALLDLFNRAREFKIFV
ncbi:MAG: lecithin retinol acyltransferase family protein [Desulfovibrio sp.]|nr:lecithin retinol acyltransferase family protein [Desulfovibrio sp.]